VQLIGKRVSHYRVLELLGAGGMGVVYRALDTKLDRQVALKFLPPRMGTEPEVQRRFVNEAKAASALDHPGICTIYEIDEDENGQLFIVMAYYAGLSLRVRLDQAPMPTHQALDIALQVAEALERAHEQGIIHRDIKPANLILTDREEVKILDFGLAKVLGGAKLTQTGTSMGTLNYMSPEQLKGESVGVGADIWALGAVLYEMLTGRVAFGGESQGAVVVNILDTHPAPIEPTGTGIDVGIERFLGRCLAKKKSDRYPSMTAIKEDLQSLVSRTKTISDISERPLHDDDQPTIPLGPNIVEEARSDSRLPGSQALFSVAVLDFSNIAADPEADWLSGGISESLTVDLKKVGSIQVIGQRAVRAAIGSVAVNELDADDLVDLGVRIGSRWIVWGAFQKSGEAIRVTAHCFDVERGRTVETLKLDGTMAQIFQLQDAIVTGLMESFELEISEMERNEIERPQTRDLEAYEYCAKARQILNRMAEPEMLQAQNYLEKAIDLDSQYAIAYSTLGQLHSFRFISETDDRDLEDAIRYLNRAIELDPALSDPYAWLTYVYSRKGRFKEAIEMGNRAAELEPDNPQAHYFLAVGYWLRGLIDYDTEGYPEAAGHLKRVIELVPRYQPGSQILGVLYFACGQYEQAWDHLRRAAEIEESGDFELGRFVGAISLLARLAYRRRKFDEAESLIRQGLEISGSVDHVYTSACNALTYCIQGDVMLATQRPDRAVAAFRQAREQVLQSRRSLGSGWPLLRAFLGQARAYSALSMTREFESHLLQAKELLDTRADFDFSGIWDGGRGEILVELALAHSVSHDQESALQCLEEASDCGWRETGRLELDRGFDSLRAGSRWQQLRVKLGDPQTIP